MIWTAPWHPSDLEQRIGRVIRRGNGNDKVHIHRYVTENTFDAYLYQLIEAKQRFASQIFTSKSPVRVAADVDESMLNYSQIKALASGNPKIREKIELEIELARMKTAENNYKRDQRLLEFQIKTIPDDIGKLEHRLCGLQADLDFVKARPSRTEKGELLPCEVQGVLYEKQKEAGEAIFKAMKHLPSQGEWFTIGHLRDMRIIAKQPYLKDYVELCIAGKRSYGVNFGSDPGGLMVRMNNVLDSGISRSVSYCEEDIEKKKRELQSAQAEFSKPFPGAKALKEKRERLQILEKELSLDNQEQEKKVPAQDEVAPESKECRSLADKIADAQRRQTPPRYVPCEQAFSEPYRS